jgi:hypothetical protein
VRFANRAGNYSKYYHLTHNCHTHALFGKPQSIRPGQLDGHMQSFVTKHTSGIDKPVTSATKAMKGSGAILIAAAAVAAVGGVAYWFHKQRGQEKQAGLDKPLEQDSKPIAPHI